jgi:hypothetical protein
MAARDIKPYRTKDGIFVRHPAAERLNRFAHASHSRQPTKGNPGPRRRRRGLSIWSQEHPVAAKLRSAALDAAAGTVEEVARVVARLRARWPRTRILLRADSGLTREELMAWCEANDVDFLFGLARNERLVG